MPRTRRRLVDGVARWWHLVLLLISESGYSVASCSTRSSFASDGTQRGLMMEGRCFIFLFHSF